MGKLTIVIKLSFIMFSIIFTSAALPQNITNTLGTSGVFKIKDGTTDHFTLTQSTGQVNILKTLRIENTTSSTTGVIYRGANRFIHSYGTGNMFFGVNSGNFTMTGSENTAFGINTLGLLTSGLYNSAFGENSLQKNTTGGYNSAFGNFTLQANTTGFYNSAFGLQTLYSNTTGFGNSAFGTYALYDNFTANNNSAFGYSSLENNITGNENSSFGYQSLYLNTSGNGNCAFGTWALYDNTNANNNSAFGYSSLKNNTTGFANSSFGNQSLYLNTTGAFNSSFGSGSLRNNTTGYVNSAFGYGSLSGNTTGYANTALGDGAGSTVTIGWNITCIGFDSEPSSPSADNEITLGNTSVSKLRCNVTAITSLSDARDKKNIKDLSLGINFLMKLKPRLYNWDKREWYDDNVSDGSKMQEAPTAGFIAQELNEIQTTENAEWLNLVLKDNPEKWEATPGNLFPIVVKAVQELKIENDVIRSENYELKNENNELKERLTNLEKMQNMLSAEIEKMKLSDEKVKEIKLGNNE